MRAGTRCGDIFACCFYVTAVTEMAERNAVSSILLARRNIQRSVVLIWFVERRTAKISNAVSDNI